MDRFEVLAGERDQKRIRKVLAREGFGEKCSMSIDVGDTWESLHVWGRVRPRLIPWVEENSGYPAKTADVIKGLREWSRLADRAIVTTVAGKLDIYDDIRDCSLDMQITPGLKTNDSLKRFHDVNGWKQIAEELADMAQRCGSDTVVLENESAVGAYGLGKEEIDFTKFAPAIHHLPKHLHVIWYPGITGSDEEAQKRMWTLCQVVVDVHSRVTLVDRTYGRPAAVKWHWSTVARGHLDEIDAPTIPMQYFYGPDKDYWQDAQIHEALGHVAEAAEVIIYPGAERFKDAAIGIRKALEAGG